MPTSPPPPDTFPPSTSLAHLYKQRYDNVSHYLEKKRERERVEMEEAYRQGCVQPVKKGRWMK